MNVFEYIVKYNLEGKRLNVRPWGSYQLGIQAPNHLIGTPAIYGWGIPEKTALAMFLTEVMSNGYIAEMQKVVSAEAYNDLVAIERVSVNELFDSTPIKEESVADGITELLRGENTSGSGSAIHQEVAL